MGPALAGKLLLLIVPPLRVGMHPLTLRVTYPSLNAHRLRDAERPGLRYHAERGNDQKRYRMRPVGLASTVGPASAGKASVCTPIN